MSELNPYEQLGVSEDASFEEIQKAKQKLKTQYDSNPELIENIEVAYDAIIMQRLRLRQEGKIKVPEQIRFPEKIVEKKKIPVLSNPQNNPSISSLFNSLILRSECQFVIKLRETMGLRLDNLRCLC